MSHFTKIKSKMTDQAVLVAALKRMGFTVEEGNFVIKEYGVTSRATVRVDESVGFSLEEDGTFAMVGDFWHGHSQLVRSFYNRNELFSKELKKNYAIEDAKAKLETLGFFMETEEKDIVVDEEGVINLSFENLGL